jgi:hypothetical protein
LKKLIHFAQQMFSPVGGARAGQQLLALGFQGFVLVYAGEYFA